MSESAATEKSADPVPGSKDPVLATILSALVPGAGHLYAGQRRRGMIWFLTIEALFFAGMWLSGSTIYQWSGAATMPPGAPKIFLLLLLPIPEIFNLSGTLLGAIGFLSPAEPFPPGFAASLGTTLSGMAGILAILCMVDVWTCAKKEGKGSTGKSVMRAVILSWAIPGWGHFYLGRRFHARVFLAAVLGLFALGLFLGGGLVTNREKYFYYWAGEALLGAPTALATVLGHGLRAERFIPFQDLGLLLTTSAGLLNVLVMLSAYSMARGEKS